jgi:hypothetical protein
MVASFTKFLLISVQLYLFGRFALAEESDLSGKILYQEKDMGVFNLTSCSSAPACGKI